ncbi:MAG: hypothetical protein QOD39_4231 [Mycobacterium sp.]|nr:hypothetical protein [Mycobacterium sp.]
MSAESLADIGAGPQGGELLASRTELFDDRVQTWVGRLASGELPRPDRGTAARVAAAVIGPGQLMEVGGVIDAQRACQCVKAALNMITVQYTKAFPGIRINAVEPGYTKTDLSHNTGTQTVEEGRESSSAWPASPQMDQAVASSTPPTPSPGRHRRR